VTGWPDHHRARGTLAASAVLLFALLVTLASGPVVTWAALAPAHPLRHRTLFVPADPRVVESSGIVDSGRYVESINDSGDGPYVYVLSESTGRTVGVTTYSSGSVHDVESLAPGRHGSVWVGDTGDNLTSRENIDIYHVPDVRPGDRTLQAPRFALAYPDGAHDAETLLVSPRDGRMFVVSKSAFGGTVYAAPRHLRTDRVNAMHTFAQVNGLVTDGTFFPDGRHVLLRTYGSASVYTVPGFGLVGTVHLPRQRQGEGISVGPQGRILVSSEGENTPVLQVFLPAALAAVVAGRQQRGPLPASVSTTTPRARRDPSSFTPQTDLAGRIGVVLVVGAVAALGYLTVRGARLRGPRRR
jgi:hypothetical protein